MRLEIWIPIYGNSFFARFIKKVEQLIKKSLNLVNKNSHIINNIDLFSANFYSLIHSTFLLIIQIEQRYRNAIKLNVWF